MSIENYLGKALGLTVAPIAFVASALRRDRAFHPDGVLYRADVKPAAQHVVLKPLAERVAGAALVRLSGALWKWPQGRRRPDLLGVALRLRGNNEVTLDLLPGDQDLTFVTASSLMGMPMSALATDTGDFLDNYYHSLLPYQLAGAGRVYLRLMPVQQSPAGPDRHARLEAAVAHKQAAFRLEIGGTRLGAGWLPVATIELRERMKISEDAFEVHPGTSAMGLVPEGLLQAMRPEIYAASEAGRRVTRG